MGATRNPKRWTVDVVIAEQKVCMVKNIEGFKSKLQMKSFGNTDVLKKRGVENPVGGSDKRFASETKVYKSHPSSCYALRALIAIA